MKLLCVQSLHSIDLLNAQLTIDGRNMTVLGLANQEVNDGIVWEWWIVEEN